MRTPPLILVVDDDKDFLEIISARLNQAGYDVVTAQGAKEGLDVVGKVMPDLILMDIYMPPGDNGTDTALAIRQNPATKDIKIAFLSSLNDPWPLINSDKVAVAKELGMEEFLEKGKDLENLGPRIQEILSK